MVVNYQQNVSVITTILLIICTVINTIIITITIIPGRQEHKQSPESIAS